ncbi:hypothetical protein [Streptomyces sp. NPDC056628]|uniref:hypothetical protein n=1 Tax=Streptomyces sp. NPDC056628 TaxID=3345882 RepID=UPI003676B9EF
MSNQTGAVRERLQQIFEAQVNMVEATATEALGRGDISVADPREAGRSAVAQLKGQVLFAKLDNNTSKLSTLWSNCLALLRAQDARVAEPA